MFAQEILGTLKMAKPFLPKEKRKSWLPHNNKEKINQVISNFINEVEKNGFNKVEVKKAVIEKLTRKHKTRK